MNEMKKAEEWIEHWDKRNTNKKDWSDHVEILRQIQLDAAKSRQKHVVGCLRSRAELYPESEATRRLLNMLADDLELLADRLTEKDL